MKKWIMLTLLTLFSFTLTGCFERQTTVYTLEDVQSQVTELYEKLSPMTVAVVSYDTTEYTIKAGHGSGLIYDRTESGIMYTYYVITNYHVIESQAYMRIFTGNKYYIATAYAANEVEDLAIVTFSTMDDLAYYGVEQFNGTKVVEPIVGSFVIAIGTPLDLEFFNTATIGIVGRTRNSKIIQHDAAINPGNSGGPLFDLSGNLLGFNTWKRTTTNTSDGEIAVDGIGFAISMDIAKDIVTNLRNTQESVFISPKIGVTVMNISDAITNLYGGVRPTHIEETQTTGVYVNTIIPLRPAVGKLKAQDIITQVNGEAVENLIDLSTKLSNMQFGQTLTLTVRRYQSGAFTTQTIILVL
ncbi:trypsin-like peptidase domain-containing protein [Acholeplasma vituli]|uniref:Trypsin-like peptidase domain-containing protein n=1 Tax=Paracholeplasma vituli TaxID=69473 RepID=A0ABT2PU05_9MOLU|nr:trypsin-like peptidase domain-containing protein [Paracholeplasma vituli]MCU0104330.1 trypsin-like peptidase domain-containing protein [Paracholeplasma vituli]